MFDIFKRKKSNLRVSNFVTAVDGRVVAREGTVVDEKFVGTLRSHSVKSQMVKVAGTFLQTHFINLLAESKYEFITSREITRTELIDVFDSVILPEPAFKELAWMQRYDYQYHHSIAVAALAACLGYMVYRDEGKVTQVASCAITHDFGITRIPERILYKQGNLDNDELKLMQEHPIYSYLLLIYYGLDEPALNAGVSFEHHENLLQNGYPRAITPHHEITQFVQISDIFDALITARPFRAAKTVQEAIAIITSMAEEGKLNKEITAALKRLF